MNIIDYQFPSKKSHNRLSTDIIDYACSAKTNIIDYVSFIIDYGQNNTWPIIDYGCKKFPDNRLCEQTWSWNNRLGSNWNKKKT